MAEKSRKKPVEEAKEREPKKPEEEETESDEASDDVDGDADDENADAEEEGREDEDEEEDGDEGEEEPAPTGERDESTKGVARALGVDRDEDEADEEAAEPEAKPNRAERRREEARRRRAVREGGGAAAKAAPSDAASAEATAADEKLPKDKNARAKELLKRRQEAASGKRVTKLDTTEMVQDSLARAGSATGKWLRDHLGMVVGALVLGIGGFAAFIVWTNHKESVTAAASDDLNRGLLAYRGYIVPKADTRPDAAKKMDPTPVYTSLDAKADAQLAAYKTVIDKHGGTGPAILARLGEASAYLDKDQWDDAISAYKAVLATPLATADVDVNGRAFEGLGFAQEGKGDLDGAIASFKELEAVNAKGFDDLGKYHQARVLLKKGDTDQAKEFLVALRKKLEIPSVDGTESPYVKNAVNDYLRGIDPSLAPKAPSLGGLRGSSFSADDLQNLDEKTLRKLQEMQMRHGGDGDDHGPPMMPGDPQ